MKILVVFQAQKCQIMCPADMGTASLHGMGEQFGMGWNFLLNNISLASLVFLYL